MKIYVAGFLHETNTFVETRTQYADFAHGANGPIAVGDAIFAMREANLPISGFLQSMVDTPNVIVPGIWTYATPSGLVTDDAYERIVSEILRRANQAQPDAVYLDLHGAMVSERYEDGEGELLRRLRVMVGQRPIIVASLDLHANVTDQMLTYADALIPFRTYPHVDMAETGARAARTLLRISERGRHPYREHWRAPFLIPIEAMATSQSPAAETYALVSDVERRYDIDLGVALGFPAADIRECGPSVWVRGSSRREVENALDELKQRFLESEAKWNATYFSPDEAVLRAKKLADAATRPIVIADTHDNPGAGADSDTTEMLATLLRHSVHRAAIGIVCDPAAAQRAHEAGVGARISLVLAEHTKHPLRGDFLIESLSDGRCRLEGPMMRDLELHLGPCACLKIDDVRVVVSTVKTQLLDRNLYRMVGIAPEEMAILVNKSSVHFRAAFEPIAEEILIARTATGIVTDPARLPWKNIDPKMRLGPGTQARRAFQSY
ncbi:microcystin degradation protein MlrC [Burkholderia ubonensis]|uniref:Microcystinase C n=1 Tax=Burkholderia ubonensis TaxID=101571 RepID=A0AB73FSE3_9BURK|nr:M81 family metallopeptidase [Burkholderia ubonensis]KVK87612.1 microcystin degradation protein MlrC [Burkholderia ubonensis]KVL66140.1 microcystin degradation protein MlrC [Burkholderia ubonensis]KVM19877.1 microcystin degradation protein MlrC [Burkholderia ubonensis]KVM26759.1 microcystin degradation protein MlrC [Burkholderia ubonensis]